MIRGSSAFCWSVIGGWGTYRGCVLMAKEEGMRVSAGIASIPGAVCSLPNFVVGYLRQWENWFGFLLASVVTAHMMLTKGFGNFSYEYGFFASVFKYRAYYHVDPLASTFIPNSSSIIFRFFGSFYDVPVAHLLAGIAEKFLIALIFYFIAKSLFRSWLAGTIAVLLLFGFPIREIGFWVPDTPLGLASDEIRAPLYFSFRQIGVIFGLGGMALLLMRRPIVSSALLGLGFYAHPQNVGAFFVVFATMLVLQALWRRQKSALTMLLAFIIPFVIVISPYVVWNLRMFPDISPIPVQEYWQFIMKNEPDDVSTRFNVQVGEFTLPLALTLVASIVFAAVLWGRRFLSEKRHAEAVSSHSDLIVLGMWAPWLLVGFGYLWESYLMGFFPDAINDLLITLQLRRVTFPAALFATLALSCGLAQVILFLVTSVLGIARRSLKLGMAQASSKAKTMGHYWQIERVLVFLIVFFVLIVTVTTIPGYKELGRFWNFHHQRYDFFLSKTVSVTDEEVMAPIPLSSLADLGDWIKANTAPDAAFFSPTYIKEFRTFAERQAFLSEKFDGNMAFSNRKFATVYLKRFRDIHGGLTYDDLPGIVFEGGDAYVVMRARYLSLSAAQVENLKKTYPGYDYLVTEVGHSLPYRLVYRNEYFLLYDLTRSN